VKLGSLLRLILILAMLGAAHRAGAQDYDDLRHDSPLPDFAVGLLPPICALGCSAVQLVDLEFLGRTSNTPSIGGFRLRLGNRAFLGARVDSSQRAFTLLSARLDARYFEDETRRAGSVEYRAARVRLQAHASQQVREGAWRVGGRIIARLSRDVEISLGGMSDTEIQAPIGLPQLLYAADVGVAWQHATWLDVLASTTLRSWRSPSGDEFNDRRVQVASLAYVGRASVTAQAWWEQTGGRFPADVVGAGLGVAYVPLSNLRVDAAGQFASHLGIKNTNQQISAGVTFFGRRYRFPRGGSAAPRVYEMVDAGWNLGLNERRSYTLAGMRRLREVVGVSRYQSALRDESAALYAATVADRELPQLDVHVTETRADVLGTRFRAFSVLVGIPWPIAPPWSTNEQAVRFLDFEFEYGEISTAGGLLSIDRTIAGTVRLNRELRAWLKWQQPRFSPLDLALGQVYGEGFEIGLRYAFGI